MRGTYISQIFLEILIEHVIRFDMKSKLPIDKGDLLRATQALVGGIENRGKGTLHVHMIFLTGLQRASNKMVEMIFNDDSFKDKLINFQLCYML